jgi:hypothetical protein
MPHYRLYFLQSRTGSIERFEEFEARDHDHAIELIQPHVGEQPLELWSRGRKVGQFEDALALSGMASAGLWVHEAAQPATPARRLFNF